MIQLVSILSSAYEVELFCKKHKWKFCFIGGIATQKWGTPRFTQDVDLTVLTGFGHESEFVDTLLKQFVPRRDDAREFALKHRVLLLRTRKHIDLDISLGAFPFEQRSIERSVLWNINAAESLTICGAEDLIIHKVFAGRDKDWGDVDSILARQFGKLNLKLIRKELIPLLELKNTPESITKFNQMVARTKKRLK